jgi:hypothetical protein
VGLRGGLGCDDASSDHTAWGKARLRAVGVLWGALVRLRWLPPAQLCTGHAAGGAHPSGGARSCCAQPRPPSGPAQRSARLPGCPPAPPRRAGAATSCASRCSTSSWQGRSDSSRRQGRRWARPPGAHTARELPHPPGTPSCPPVCGGCAAAVCRPASRAADSSSTRPQWPGFVVWSLERPAALAALQGACCPLPPPVTPCSSCLQAQ